MSKKKPSVSASRELVPAGPKQVQKKFGGKRDENGVKPSTSRAIILRNGKYGARGTGEVVLAGRISGREKLDLLAEDLVSRRSRTALLAPFKLDKCIRIADSQYNAYLDDIADLKDPGLFYDRILAELAARFPHGARDSQQPAQTPLHVTSVVSTRVHNAYLVASGWKLVVDILRDLQNSGLNEATASSQLQSDDSLRSRYLVLCDILSILVELGQSHFSLLATTTPHYSRYFKEVENIQPGEPSIAFDWAGLKDACRSFLDSIIIELCFPRSPYPKRILYHILHDAVDEAPREAKRFPQAMWDSVGDLSVSLELQELLERPLLGPEGEKLRNLPRRMPEQYDRWLDAQIYSNKASASYANFKDLINPLERTKDPSVLDNMWKFINLNYKAASGLSIDSLWQLDEALHRTPQWSSFYMSSLRVYESDSDDSKPSMSRARATGAQRPGGKKRKKLLAITDGRGDDDDGNDSMPELQSVSESSENDEDVFVSEDGEEEETDDDDDDETDYDSEDEELYRTMLREAMDTAMAIPEFFDPKTTAPEFDALADERKGNPFLKLLGSLRGRMFSSDPKLSSTTRTEPRRGYFGKKTQAPDKQATTPKPGPKTREVSVSKAPPTQPVPSKERQPVSAPEEPKGYRATVEDAEDEEDVAITAGKKKKKKPKKKKKKATNELPTVHEDSVPPISTPPKSLSASTLAETPAKVRSNTVLRTNTDAPVNKLAHMSTSSLPIEPTVAKSAHSYLQELSAPKEKVKSRPNHASLFSDKRGFLSKLGSKDKEKNEDENDPTVNKKFTWFNKLGKKTSEYMHQLLRTNADEKVGSLKWDNFLKIMREMGFKYDPSTAGSSVRFDPPDRRDKSITFHKPHPDSTLHAADLGKIRKRLKDYYGWSEEDFLKKTSAI